MFLPYCQRQSFAPIQNQLKNYSFVYSNYFLDRGEKTKCSGLNDSNHYQNSISS
jgi:hypothetical protein